MKNIDTLQIMTSSSTSYASINPDNGMQIAELLRVITSRLDKLEGLSTEAPQSELRSQANVIDKSRAQLGELPSTTEYESVTKQGYDDLGSVISRMKVTSFDPSTEIEFDEIILDWESRALKIQRPRMIVRHVIFD